MKNIQIGVFIIGIIINLCFVSTDTFADSKSEVNSKELIIVFNDLCKIVKATNNSDKYVEKRIDLVNDKINSNELLFIIDNNLPKSIFGGIEFNGANKGYMKSYVKANEFVLGMHEKHPSIVYSAIMHEIQHAYNYYTDPNEILKIDNNILERYLYEMDAYYTEAKFIREYISKKDYKMTGYEDCLVDSLERDSLYSFSVSFLGIDMKTVYMLYELRNKPDNQKNEEIIIEIGNDIIDTLKSYNKYDEFKKYSTIARAYSYCLYVPQVLYDINYYTNGNDDPDKFKIENSYPKIFKIVNKINKTMIPNIDMFKKMNKKIIDQYKNE
ncbi:MAG: hypothetical protein A2297_02645 [Elusimicrobia bacterium RIFOXYB2_FULL_48_7]|nr:MAG: hypothetical protein A2297_02645 [Elusimicrobia bacterium RIFOXYB2_FULL_48_7]